MTSPSWWEPGKLARHRSTGITAEIAASDPWGVPAVFVERNGYPVLSPAKPSEWEPISDYKGRLVLRFTDDGYRHYLDGLAVLPGNVVEVNTDTGWVRGRYEWDGRSGSPPEVHFDTDDGRGACFLLFPWFQVRWA